MELFKNAKTVRMKSHHDKYLLADDDEEHVLQDRDGSIRNARWTVEIPNAGGGEAVIRLKSMHGRYLTASNEPMLFGMTGRRVTQSLPRRPDSSVEWEPIRDGFQVKLKTRYGHFLRANGGLPPWRNSITHDIPHRTSTQEWILWDIEIVEVQTKSPLGDDRQQKEKIYASSPPRPEFSSSMEESSAESTPAMLSPRRSPLPSSPGRSPMSPRRSREDVSHSFF